MGGIKLTNIEQMSTVTMKMEVNEIKSQVSSHMVALVDLHIEVLNTLTTTRTPHVISSGVFRTGQSP